MPKRKREKANNALAVWELTLKKGDQTPEQVWHRLKSVTCITKFVYQEEKGGETNYEHYQLRINISPKARENSILRDLMKAGFVDFNLRQTTTREHKGFSYQMKEDTRVAGPWQDDHRWESMMPRMLKLPPLAWHEKIIPYIRDKRPHLRKVICIHDGPGKKGKSYLRKYLSWHGLAVVVPPQQKAEDIAACVMCQPESRCYVIDIPRSEKTSPALWAGIESLKDGYCYDKRFKWRSRNFDNPHIVVLTNERPRDDYLSPDRWVFIDLENVVMPAQAMDYDKDDDDLDDLRNDIQCPTIGRGASPSSSRQGGELANPRSFHTIEDDLWESIGPYKQEDDQKHGHTTSCE